MDVVDVLTVFLYIVRGFGVITSVDVVVERLVMVAVPVVLQ